MWWIYLPIMSDESLIVDKTGVFSRRELSRKSRHRGRYNNETLGGATTHSEISGVTDYKMPNDQAALVKIQFVDKIEKAEDVGFNRKAAQLQKMKAKLFGLLPSVAKYSLRHLSYLETVSRWWEYDEYKAGYGKTIITAYALLMAGR